MEKQFRLGIPTGLSTLSIPRNMSAINRRLISSNRDYRVSLRFSPSSGTSDGLVQVSSAPNAWCTHSMWRHGERLREMFYDSVGVEAEEHISNGDFHKLESWPFRLFTDNPYDEFRPYLDQAHWNGQNGGVIAGADEAPEISGDGTGANFGEWDYTSIGLYGVELLDGSTEDLDESDIVLLANHNTTPTTNAYRYVGLVESWLQNTNAPASALEELPVRDPDVDNPAMMLQRGTIEDAIEDGMTIVTESNLTRPYVLDQVYDTLVVRGEAHFDTDSHSWLSVPSFDCVGGLLRFSNDTEDTVFCTVTVHDL